MSIKTVNGEYRKAIVLLNDHATTLVILTLGNEKTASNAANESTKCDTEATHENTHEAYALGYVR